MFYYYCLICKICYLFQLAQLIVNAGGVAAVVDYIGETTGNVRLPGLMMLGYVGAQSENLAMAVIVSKVSRTVISKFLSYYIYRSQLSKIFACVLTTVIKNNVHLLVF